jgi:hypothetical protein
MKNSTKSLTRTVWALLVIAIAIAVMYVSANKYNNVVPPAAIQNHIITEKAVNEFGEYNDPVFKPAIDLYLSDLKVYEDMDMVPIDQDTKLESTAHKLYPVLVAKLSTQTVDQEIRDADPEILKELARHIGILLTRAAGMANEEYLAAIGSNTLSMPERKQRLDDFRTTFAKDITDTDTLMVAFDKAFRAESSFRDGSNKISGWTNDERGVAIALDLVPSTTPCDEIHGSVTQLDNRFTEAEHQLMDGGVTQGSIVFALPTTKPAEFNTGNYLRSEVMIVIKTAGNDYYPMGFHSVYDSNDHKWHLLYVNRTTSIRMASSPSKIY